MVWVHTIETDSFSILIYASCSVSQTFFVSSSRLNYQPWCNSRATRKQLVMEHRRQAGDGRRQQWMWQVVRDRRWAQGLQEICQQHLLATYYWNLFLWPDACLGGDVLAQQLWAALGSASELIYSLSQTFLVKVCLLAMVPFSAILSWLPLTKYLCPVALSSEILHSDCLLMTDFLLH